MARKAGRFNANRVQSTEDTMSVSSVKGICNIQYRVALYARMSVEREDRKSDSIDSQFMIMENFIGDKPELSQYRKYSDRGVSGTTFSRPDFNRMMDDVRAGYINCIVVKDLSRFGRDYLETGNYIETILPFLGVRFISVNDHFDTLEDCNGNKGLGISLMNLVNDMYAKDVSKRVSTAFRNCMERGSALGTVPYGYAKVQTTQGYRYDVDAPAADIVRRMFRMAKDGMSTRVIADTLTKEGVRNPEGYKRTGLVYVGKGECLSEWQHATVSVMLSNEVYLGRLLQGKSQKRLYKKEEKHKVEREKWIVHENAHEPIVSEELFAEVRNVIEKRREKIAGIMREDLPQMSDKYKGILKCAVCGAELHRESSVVHLAQGDERRYHYRCRHKDITGKESKRMATIAEEKLDLLVFSSIQKLMMELTPDKKRLLSVLESSDEVAEQRFSTETANLKKKKERLQYDGSILYGRYVKGELTKEAFADANRKQEETLKQLNTELLQMEKEYKEFQQGRKEQRKFVNALLSVKEKSLFTTELVQALISELVLSEDKTLEIKYRINLSGESPLDTAVVLKKERCDAESFLYTLNRSSD